MRSSSLKISCLALLLAAWGSQQAFAGSIVRLFYDNITGTAIRDLTTNAIFPNGFTGSETLTQFFEGATDTAGPDNFGSWIRGYLEAPQNGNYTFWVASDDPSQLWLSTDTTQAHTNLIAYVPDAGYTAVREYTKYASQKSVPIALVKGQKYYVEVFHKEGTGGDNLSVGWTLPDGTLERPILGYRLESYNPPGTALTISAQPQSQFVVEATPVVFFVTVDVGGDTRPTFQWYKGSSAITGETLSSYTIPKVNLADNNTSYYCMVNSTKSDVATLNVSADTTPPALASASTLGYDTFIQVSFSKPVTPATASNKANYSIPGVTVNSATLQSDGTNAWLMTSKLDLTKVQTLTINGIKDFAATPNTGNNLTAQLGPVRGTITRMVYLNIGGGTTVAELTGNAKFPNRPDTVEYPTLFEGVTSLADNYGTYFQGLLVPDVTANYSFAIASDDCSQLWLSTDDNPANKVLIARLDGWCNSRQFTTIGSGTRTYADSIHLNAGQKYYIEALHKEGASGDNIAVAWQQGGGPIADNTEPIPGVNLIPWIAPTVPIAITNQPASLTLEQSRAAIFSVDVQGTPAYTGIQWYRNGQPIDGATSLSYTNPIVALTNNGDTYYAIVTNLAYSVQSSSAVLSVTPDTTPPSVVLATTVLGTSVNVQFSELLDPVSAANKANYAIANVTITSATLSADGKTVVLPITGTLPANFQITINNVKDFAGNTIPANTTVPGYTTGLSPGMISYWPLDEVQGTKTPDIISGYDMTLDNLTTNDLVQGHAGKCLQFDNARKTLLKRVHGTNDLLPIYKYPTLTVSIWVNGAANQNDRRIFCESSSTANNPLFDVGSQNVATSSGLDSFIRNDSNTTTGGSGGHHYHTTVVYDSTWHHVVYVQHATNTSPRAEIYIDGVKDPVNPEPVWPLTVNTTAIGGVQRASAAAWFTGMIDDVAVWNRDLSAEEVGFIYTKGTPTPTPKVLPLAINSFSADLPAVAKGDSVTLHWDVSKDATSISITPDVGDVTSSTSVGAGSAVVTLTQSKTYRLTVRRFDEVLIRDVQVAAIDNVASDWSLLDNFDRYTVGALPTATWLANGTFAQVVNVNGNLMLSPAVAAMVCAFPLNTMTITEGQQRTLFTRFYLPQAVAAGGVDLIMGLTDKAIRAWADHNGDLGPGVHFQNVNGDLQIGTANGNGSTPEYSAFALQPQTVYNLWINIQNDPIATGDLVSMFIAKDGDANRTTLFTDYRSDRNPNDTTLLGPTGPDLNKVLVAANSATSSVYFDDFYLSKSGYISTVPHPYGFTTPIPEVVTTPPTLTATLSQANVVVSWAKALGTGFVLQGTKSLAKPIIWTTVTQPVVDAGTNSTVTIPAAQSYEFYQLVK